MAEYNVTLKDTVAFAEEITAPGSKVTDVVSFEETFIGQGILVKDLVTINETFGPAILHYSEDITFVESHTTKESWLAFADYLQISEGFDASTSVLSNPLKHDDTVSILETFGVTVAYSCLLRDTIQVAETRYLAERVDYQTEDQYYYRPR